MGYENILLEKDGNIASITLNRPEDYNRLNPKMDEELLDALQKMSQDDGVNALIIKAAGRNFCVGMAPEEFKTDGEAPDACIIDTNQQTKGKTPLELIEMNRTHDDMLNAISNFPKGTVSAVNGWCLAAGPTIALRCDITIMEEDAEIGFTAINVGLGCIASIRYLENIIGQKKAMEMILTGERLTAYNAERIGLINKIAPKGKLLEVAKEKAELLASKSPLAIKIIKESNNLSMNMNRSDAKEFLNRQFLLLATSEDGQEGVKAYTEKRPPIWKRR